METIYSGFDTILFAVQGALCPKSLETLKRAKAQAKDNDAPVLMKICKNARGVHVMPHGMQGGYTYVVTTGGLGEQIRFKESLDRKEWNGFVKLYSATLAVLDWREAIDQAMKALDDIGFHHMQISLNRVDYCVDILNAAFKLNPDNFVAHARATKSSYIERVHGVSRGDTYETVTVGKSPGRQVTIYDKRREVISKNKPHWFEIWNIKKDDPTLAVHRVEVRAYKNELKKFGIVTWKDFELKIGDVISTAFQKIRYLQTRENDQNVTRQALHPIWLHVQHHVEKNLWAHITHVEPSRVLHVIRETKSKEYMSQIIGLCAGLAVCTEVPFEHVADHVTTQIKQRLEDDIKSEPSPLRRAYVRAEDRLHFILE